MKSVQTVEDRFIDAMLLNEVQKQTRQIAAQAVQKKRCSVRRDGVLRCLQVTGRGRGCNAKAIRLNVETHTTPPTASTSN